MCTPDSNTPALKTCPKCSRALPLTSFARNGTAKDGLQYRCRQCNAEWYAETREARIAYNRKWCEEHRQEIATYNAAYRAGHSEERFAYKAAYRAAHREEVTVYQAAYRLKHLGNPATYERNRNARKKGNGGTHTAIDIQAQHDRQKGRCFWCNVKLGGNYHVDHVIPLVKGGSNGPENLVVACPKCNDSKGGKHPMDFAGVMF